MGLVSNHVYSMLVTTRRSQINTSRGKGTQGLLLRRCFSSLLSFLLLAHRHRRLIIRGKPMDSLCGGIVVETIESNEIAGVGGKTSPRPTAYTEMHKRSKAYGWKANRYCTHKLLMRVQCWTHKTCFADAMDLHYWIRNSLREQQQQQSNEFIWSNIYD